MEIAKSALPLAVLAVITLNLTSCSAGSSSNQTSPNSNVTTVSGSKKLLKAFYEAVRGKNEAEIKRALSKNSVAKLENVSRQMTQQNYNYYIYKLAFEREGLIGQSEDPEALIEMDVVGEKVESDKAVLDLKNPETGQMTQAKFVMEDGAWKIDILNQQPASTTSPSK